MLVATDMIEGLRGADKAAPARSPIASLSASLIAKPTLKISFALVVTEGIRNLRPGKFLARR